MLSLGTSRPTTSRDFRVNRAVLTLPTAALLLSGCGLLSRPHGGVPAPAPQPTPVQAATVEGQALSGAPLSLTDVTKAAGISFQHHSGAFGKKWFPETNGSGAAMFDYD